MPDQQRHFSWFFYGDFPFDASAEKPDDPRFLQGEAADRALSWLLSASEKSRASVACPALFDANIRRLLACGVLRQEGERLALNTPVFTREDAPVLREIASEQAESAFAALRGALPGMLAACRALDRAFAPEVHLYHLLCGVAMDGSLFDALAERGALALSRGSDSGERPLVILYEDCPELNAFSDRLLCSWNRLDRGDCALQSFGDADGERFDAFRLCRMVDRGRLTGRFAKAAPLIGGRTSAALREWLPGEARRLVCTGRCDGDALRLLELLGYAASGRVCVPVYRPGDEEIIHRIAVLAEQAAADAMAEALARMRVDPRLLAVREGAPALEIANELYHVLFGSLNARVVKAGFAACPPYAPGEGRFLRSIQIAREI